MPRSQAPSRRAARLRRETPQPADTGVQASSAQTQLERSTRSAQPPVQKPPPERTRSLLGSDSGVCAHAGINLGGNDDDAATQASECITACPSARDLKNRVEHQHVTDDARCSPVAPQWGPQGAQSAEGGEAAAAMATTPAMAGPAAGPPSPPQSSAPPPAAPPPVASQMIDTSALGSMHAQVVAGQQTIEMQSTQIAKVLTPPPPTKWSVGFAVGAQ